MARKIDELGRIVLPVELRRLHGIRPGDALAISVDGDTIVLRKIDEGCVFCGGATALTIFRGRRVCAPCTGQLGRPDGDGHSGDGHSGEGHSGDDGQRRAPSTPLAADVGAGLQLERGGVHDTLRDA